MHKCPWGGRIVGAKEWISPEPFDYDWGRVDWMGCNRLRCGRCRATVRNNPGYEIADTPRFQKSLLTVYEARDWTNLDMLTRQLHMAEKTRLYLCRCQFKAVIGSHVVAPDDHGAINSFQTEWRCSGHPDLALPCKVDDVAIDDQTDLSALVRDSFLGTIPISVPAKWLREPAAWITRLYAVLEPSETRRNLSRTVARHLESEDVLVRRCALKFFANLRDAPGIERVAQLAQSKSSLFGSEPDPLKPKYTMHMALQDTIEERLRFQDVSGRIADRLAVDVARAWVLEGTADPQLVYALGHDGPEWFTTNAVAIVSRTPSFLGGVLSNLEKAPFDIFVATARQLSAIDAATSERVRSWVQRSFNGRGRETVLAAIVA